MGIIVKLAAIRAKQGGRDQITVAMPIVDVVTKLPVRDETEWRSISGYNRPIDKRHVDDMVKYIISRDDWIRVPLLVGVPEGTLVWNGRGDFGTVTIDDEALEIGGGVVDGQHTVVALRKAVALLKAASEAETDEGVEATARLAALMEESIKCEMVEGTLADYRQMYADVAKAKAPGKETVTLFEQHDAFAIAARIVADVDEISAEPHVGDGAHPLLRKGGVNINSQRAGDSLISLSGLASIAYTLASGKGGRGRRSETTLTAEAIAERLTGFLDALAESTPLARIVEGVQTVQDARSAGVLPAFDAGLNVYSRVWYTLAHEQVFDNASEILSMLPHTRAEAFAEGESNPFKSLIWLEGKAPRGGGTEMDGAVGGAKLFLAVAQAAGVETEAPESVASVA